MIWFLQRGIELCMCEARHEGERFELAVATPGGAERVEQFEDPSVLLERLVDCQQDLRRHGWRLLDDDQGHRRVGSIGRATATVERAFTME
jgi:hypothetical protein